jgi:uncharacterized protein
MGKGQFILFAGALVWAGQVLAAAPGVDCARAVGAVEKLVCNDDGLATLDRALAEVYGRAERSLPAKDVALQREAQREWIKKRDAYAKTADVRACVERAFRTRTIELQIVSGQLTAPAAVPFACQGHESTPFSTAYYQTDPPSAVFTFGDQQVVAFVALTGSGARYLGPGVDFWEHQGEAAVTWYGTKMTCKPQKGRGE